MAEYPVGDTASNTQVILDSDIQGFIDAEFRRRAAGRQK
jgi:hypothetical protein